ncbi:MAG: potassium channel family protein [Rhodopirellula sp. JB044]|uniref:potassium channel family protein n=1 Tax=Rhodopirellula sp. JB044 TaxID=3342844 RepID=UPI00370C2DB2
MPNSSLTDAMSGFDAYRIDSLSLDHIQRFLGRIDQEIDLLAAEIETNREGLGDAREQADPFVFQKARRMQSRYQFRADYLLELREQLDDVYQRKYMQQGMAGRLGGYTMLRVFELVILALIVIVLGLLVYDLAAGPDEFRPRYLSSNMIFIVDACCCAIFMSEFVLRLWSAESKAYVWKHHWVDFVTSIPIPGEAQLARFGRFARLARFARLLRLLRFLRLFFFLWRGLDKLQDVMDVKIMKKTIRYAVFATIAGAFLIYKLEGSISGNSDNAVSTFGQSAWWSFTTVLTGGFGDIHNPESLAGQVLTGLLVVIGMVLVGVFTATLTTIFVGEQQENEANDLEKILEKIDALPEVVQAEVRKRK